MNSCTIVLWPVEPIPYILCLVIMSSPPMLCTHMSRQVEYVRNSTATVPHNFLPCSKYDGSRRKHQKQPILSQRRHSHAPQYTRKRKKGRSRRQPVGMAVSGLAPFFFGNMPEHLRKVIQYWSFSETSNHTDANDGVQLELVKKGR